MTVYLHITRNLTGIAIFCWNVNKRFFSVLNYDKIDSNAEVTLDLLDNTEVARYFLTIDSLLLTSA